MDIQIETFIDLTKHEKEIVEIINNIPYGGNLFVLNPFLLLQDIGVHLSDTVKKEIINIEPSLANLSSISYSELKKSQEKQKVVFHLKGLFQRSHK